VILDLMEYWIAWLWRIGNLPMDPLQQTLLHRLWNPDFVFLNNREGV
jgi:hypothetical protein